MRRHRDLVGWLFVSPWVLGFLFFTLGPFLASVGLSFTRYNLVSPPRWVGTANYEALFHDDAAFLHSLLVTLRYAAVVVPLTTVASVALALLLNLNVRGMPLFRAIFYLPSILPVVATATVFQWILNPETGLVNRALALVGIAGPAWLLDPRWAPWALVLMAMWGVGGSMVILLAGLKDVPTALYEAALLDGARPWERARFVTIPLLTPAIFFNVVMATIGSVGTFTEAYVVTKGGPEDSTTFVGLYLWNRAWKYLDLGYASAIAWILFGLTVAVVGAVFGSQRRWVHYGR